MRTLKTIGKSAGILSGLLLAAWLGLCALFPGNAYQPLDYRICPPGRTKGCGRYTHDDRSPKWLFSKIPRKLTTFDIPMSPLQVWGNQEPRWLPVQDCYPMAADTQYRPAQAAHHIAMGVKREYKAWPPVPDINRWTILSAPLLPARVPSYFAVSARLFNKRGHFNLGLKPDGVLTPDRWKTEDGPIKDVWGDRLRPDDGCHVGDSAWNFPETSLSFRALKPEEQDARDFGWPAAVCLSFIVLLVCGFRLLRRWKK